MRLRRLFTSAGRHRFSSAWRRNEFLEALCLLLFLLISTKLTVGSITIIWAPFSLWSNRVTVNPGMDLMLPISSKHSTLAPAESPSALTDTLRQVEGEFRQALQQKFQSIQENLEAPYHATFLKEFDKILSRLPLARVAIGQGQCTNTNIFMPEICYHWPLTREQVSTILIEWLQKSEGIYREMLSQTFQVAQEKAEAVFHDELAKTVDDLRIQLSTLYWSRRGTLFPCALVATLFAMYAVTKKYQTNVIHPNTTQILDELLKTGLGPWPFYSGLRFIYLTLRPPHSEYGYAKIRWRPKHYVWLYFSSSTILAIVRSGGIESQLKILIYFETVFLLMALAKCSVGIGKEPRSALRDFRYRPKFALAVMIQIVLFVVLHFIIPNIQADLAIYMCCFIAHSTLFAFVFVKTNPEFLAEPVREKRNTRKMIQFCRTCQTTVLAPGVRKSKVHHWKTSDLLSSRNEGCRICSAVWQSRTKMEKDFKGLLMFWKPVTSIEWAPASGLSIRSEQNRHYRNNKTIFSIHNKIDNRPDENWSTDTSLGERLANTVLSDHTGSPESLDTAATWLRDCLDNHKHCKAQTAIIYSPTRLLFLGKSERVSELRIHLHQDRAKDVPYMTLSHCWGGAESLRLLRSNEAEFRIRIPQEKLPQTFKDAIKIARYLRFEYLWIDSLCIIQDSVGDDDWVNEASQMGSIYRGSTCNIAAPDAKNSHDGCLYERDPRAIQPELYPAYNSDAATERYLVNDTLFYGDPPLYTRAWVLQEFLLAPRALDCGKLQLFWHCAETRASEVFVGGVPTSITNEEHPASEFKAISTKDDYTFLSAGLIEDRLRQRDLRKIVLERGISNIELASYINNPYAYWKNVVEAYTKMRQTKPADRIVALAGIVDIFRPFWGDYLFGTWQIFMPVELVWKGWGGALRTQTARAPTWSWLSMDGPIDYAHCTVNPRHKDVVLTTFVRAGPTHLPTGEISLALHLRSPLLRAKWSGVWDQDGYRRFHLKIIEERSHPNIFPFVPISSRYYGSVFFDTAYPGPEPPTDIVCLPIKSSILEGVSEERIFVGLVLRPISGGFERIGSFEDGLLEDFTDFPVQDVVLI